MTPLLIPLISKLAESGLTLLSGAIQAKGKEVVENALGVKIPDDPSPEEIESLRQAQYDHEERLIELGIEKAKQELEGFKEEVKDKQNARERDSIFIRMGRSNWRADIMVALAAIAVAGLVWMVWKDQELNEYVKGIVTLVLGRFLGYLDNIYNFEFGTTRGSKAKDDTIRQLSGGKE
jgi:hypothetical protein